VRLLVKGLLLCRNSAVSSCKVAKPPILFCFVDRDRGLDSWCNDGLASAGAVGADDGHGCISISVFLTVKLYLPRALVMLKMDALGSTPTPLLRKRRRRRRRVIHFFFPFLGLCGDGGSRQRTAGMEKSRIRCAPQGTGPRRKNARMSWLWARVSCGKGKKSFTFRPTAPTTSI
jgi:hypothetical protein